MISLSVAKRAVLSQRSYSGWRLRWLRRILQQRIAGLQRGRIIFIEQWPGHRQEWQLGGPAYPPIKVRIHHPDFYWQLLLAGSNGVATAYRDGLWSCSDLSALLALVAQNQRQMDAIESGWATLGNRYLRWRHRRRKNTLAGSQRNIQAHYDLDNEFFKLFLDPTLTYSAGIFETPSSTLMEASISKLDRICQKLGLNASHHVLEIGTGWGSFTLHAASHYGCRVTTTTLSRAQYELARKRIHAAGLQDRIELLLCDYRKLSGQYDKLVSVEMVEAVGHEYLSVYFEQCAKLLKPNGQMLIQAITLADQQHAAYLKRSDFIQQYIFPGGCLPSLSSMLEAIRHNTDFRVSHLEDIGSHYATTLRHWLRNFKAAEKQVRKLGYPSDFIRLWEFYLCYCEAGLQERYLGTLQCLLDKPGWRGAPLLGDIQGNYHAEQ